MNWFDKGEWIKTDDLQWRCKVNNTTYHLVEVRERPDDYVFVVGIIDIEDYTEDEIKSYITGYGYESVGKMKEEYGEDTNGVIAECIFECTDIIELTGFGGFDTEDDAEKAAQEYIDRQ